VHPEIAATLLARAPRVATGGMNGRGVIWADARGFSTPGKAELANELLAILARRGINSARAGIADTPVAAEIAAVHGGSEGVGTSTLTIVPSRTDRAFVGLFPLSVLEVEQRLEPLFFGIGVSTCGELAALQRESIEVRLGSTAVPLWKLARADDPRLIFSPAPAEAPHASLDWVEYALRDPMRLLFVLNNLIERVCTTLAVNGEGARELTIEFALTNRSVHVEMIRASRPTANRRTWIRLARTRVEHIKLTAAVTGITVHASKVAAREAPQGDLFDRGLASSEATEEAVARLIEDQGEVVVAPQNSAPPQLDQRTTMAPRKPVEAVTSVYAAELTKRDVRGPTSILPAPAEESRQSVRLTPVPALTIVREVPATSYQPPATSSPKLLLQLAPSPLSITVETTPRRDHLVPIRFRDDEGWHEIVNAAGPERVSGRTWDGDRAYAREYFRCVTKEGVLVWLYRDANEKKKAARMRAARPSAGRWFLHGWWD
jgi:protein ImuB